MLLHIWNGSFFSSQPATELRHYTSILEEILKVGQSVVFRENAVLFSLAIYA